jgi:hypothetical protein
MSPILFLTRGLGGIFVGDGGGMLLVVVDVGVTAKEEEEVLPTTTAAAFDGLVCAWDGEDAWLSASILLVIILVLWKSVREDEVEGPELEPEETTLPDFFVFWLVT